MKSVLRLMLSCVLVSASMAASASDAGSITTCHLSGELRKAEQLAAIEGSKAYSFQVRVTTAGQGDDASCGKLVGTTMDVDLTVPDRAGVPRRGGTLAFERDAVQSPAGDYFDYRFVSLAGDAAP